MEPQPTLLRTLRLVMKQLETAGSQAQPDDDFTAAREAVSEWIKRAEYIEEADPSNLVMTLQDIFLDRKGIFVAARMSAANVRAILRANGFNHLAEVDSNEEIVSRMIDVREGEYSYISEMQDRLELQTAREMVEDAGLDWPEDEESLTQVRSEAGTTEPPSQ